MSRSEDFPAAHSMDTEWFAVDQEGRVGRFDTGEDGALPTDAGIGMAPFDGNVDWMLLQAMALGNALAAGAELQLEEYDPLKGADGPQGVKEAVVVVVGTTEPFQGLIDAGRLEPVWTGQPSTLIARKGLDDAEAALLVTADEYVVTTIADDLFELIMEHDCGFFVFDHDHGEDTGLYEKRRTPEHPLTLDGVHERLRTAVGNLKLPFDFTADSSVHLADVPDIQWQTWGDLPLRYSDEWRRTEQARAERMQRRRENGGRHMVVLVLILALVAALWLYWRFGG